MRLYKLGGGEWDIELILQVGNAFCFGFAAAVSEEDEGDSFRLKVAKGIGGARECGGGAEKDAVDAGRTSAWL